MESHFPLGPHSASSEAVHPPLGSHYASYRPVTPTLSMEFNSFLQSYIATKTAAAKDLMQSSTGRKVGDIEYDLGKILGKADKTFVYKGTFQELVLGQTVGRRGVAVKKIICGCREDSQMCLKEVEILFSCNHDNIIKYYKTETDDDYNVCIAIELCLGTLQDWMEGKIEEIQPGEENALEILRQTTEAVKYLHSKGIIHRDLKPENILLKVVNGNVRVKVADFGKSRIIPQERTSLTIKTSSGTKGWKSPEILNAQSNPSERFEMSTATDIFSLGCLFYYVLSGGKHPFDVPGNDLDSNIRNNRRNIDNDHFSPRIRRHITLFKKMIRSNRRERPTASDILRNPIFWNYKKECDFICEISNLLRDNSRPVVQTCKHEINEGHRIYANEKVSGWQTRVCPNIMKYSLRYSKYDDSLASDLLRLIRNLYNHYDKLPRYVKASLGPPPLEFMVYWDSRYPDLVPGVWNVCKELLGHEGFDSIKEFY